MDEAPSRISGSVRAVALAWLATTASTFAHIAAGGDVPMTAVTASVVFGLTVLCAPLVTRPLTVRRAVVLMGGLQLLVHTVSTWFASTTGPVVPRTPPIAAALAGGPGHGVGASSGAHPVSHAGHAGHLGSDAVGAVGAMDPASTLSMLGVHVLTAALLGWALAASERSGRAAAALTAVHRSAAMQAVLRIPTTLVRRAAAVADRPQLREAPLGVFHWAAPAFFGSLWAPQGGARRGPPIADWRCAGQTSLWRAATCLPCRLT